MNHNNYGWVYTENTYKGVWRATNRDNYLKLFDGPDDCILQSPNIDDIRAVVNECEGDIYKVMKWKKEKGLL